MVGTDSIYGLNKKSEVAFFGRNVRIIMIIVSFFIHKFGQNYVSVRGSLLFNLSALFSLFFALSPSLSQL